jgi:gamma-glutamyltranspeptidase / glutathione hydrolase
MSALLARPCPTANTRIPERVLMKRLRRVASSVLLYGSAAIMWESQLSAQDRPDVQGTEAAVVADHPLAAAAGADVLRRGGNAVDAAITMAAVLAVVRPHMNGIGGDAFLLIRERNGKVRALNGSGRSGTRATAGAVRALGHETMPEEGILSVTVPGAVRAWSDALRRHGTITLAAALAPAIRYARDGFPVSEKLAADITASRAKLLKDRAIAAVFLPGGNVPVPGSLLRQTDLANSLELIAREGADAVYVGELARRIDKYMTEHKGLVTIGDLADHSSLWQEPIATTYAGHRVLAFPPNSQGVALLMQMNMAELFNLKSLGHNQPDYVRTLVELKRLAFAERDRFVSDPAMTDIPLDRMMSKEHARELVATWTTDRAGTPRDATSVPQPAPVSARSPAGDGDTVFLAVVDNDGNAVALIQSLYNAFGSGLMIPGTGMVLHNRGGLFSLDPANVNVLAPHKRTYHTLAPAMALRPDDSLAMIFGTPGSDGQTQTQLQVFNNIVLFGMTPQRAVEAPRWRSWDDGRLQIEDGIAAETRDRLAAAGYNVSVQKGRSSDLGGAQVIMITKDGVKRVGADPRREAYGIAW